jgi:hypothetical protein
LPLVAADQRGSGFVEKCHIRHRIVFRFDPVGPLDPVPAAKLGKGL